MDLLIAFLVSDLAKSIIVWLLPLLVGVGLNLVKKHLRWKRGADILGRLSDLSARAVMATYAEYTKQILLSQKDGLTQDEKRNAKNMALAKLKDYCGWDDLLFVLGSEAKADLALNDAIESSLEAAKSAGLIFKK